jgi:hypothetical protein
MEQDERYVVALASGLGFLRWARSQKNTGETPAPQKQRKKAPIG